MKRILYFILACVTIVYIAFLCYFNIAGNVNSWSNYVAVYGGLIIAVAYAIINFIGNPLKMVFFIVLIVAVVALVLTIAIPDVLRQLFGIKQPTEVFLFS